jgi:endonuclease-3
LKPAATVRRVIETLSEQHPNADTELRYRNAFELLAATILSAQSTDERVNMVTPALFARYPNARVLARATPAELEPQIVSTGFFRQKSKALIGMAQALVAGHGGEVPADMEKLIALPGVGRKTANVVLGHALGVPGLPVDRHVLRVANRIGIAESDDPETVEAQLCEALPPQMWTLASDVQILHGRRVCRPKPLCDECSIRDDCDYYRNVILREPAATTTVSTTKHTKRAKTGGATRAATRAAAKGEKSTKRTALAKVGEGVRSTVSRKPRTKRSG